MKLTDTIETLRAAMASLYGTSLNTYSGAGTITIAHDRVELNDPAGNVIAEGVEACALHLAETYCEPVSSIPFKNRRSFATKAEQWCAKHNVPPTPFNIVTACLQLGIGK